jgi:Uma2 family endonuclease
MALAERYVGRTNYTEEEYFEMERTSFGRWEYVNGEIRLMAGGKDDHNVIAMNIARVLGNILAPRDCRVYGPDMKIHTGDGINTFPDVAVVCGDRQYYQGREDIILNPLLVVEVPSPSTAAYDKKDKFEHYKSVPALREYLLVDQDQAHILLYTCHADTWDLNEVSDRNGSIFLSSIQDTLLLSEIYFKIKFEAEPA